MMFFHSHKKRSRRDTWVAKRAALVWESWKTGGERERERERAAHANRTEKRVEEALVRDPDVAPAFYMAQPEEIKV